MAKIEFNWECQACLAMNPQTVQKPGHFQSSIFSAKCKGCQSSYTIKVVKFKGDKHSGQIHYGVIDANLTDEGKRIFDERQNIKQAEFTDIETKPSANTAET